MPAPVPEPERSRSQLLTVSLSARVVDSDCFRMCTRCARQHESWIRLIPLSQTKLATEPEPVPGPEPEAVIKECFSSYEFLLAADFAAPTLQHRCGRVQAEFTSKRRWALALRPEHHP